MGVMDTLNWLGETATKPSAAVLGLMAGRPGQLANLIPFSDTIGITNPRDRSTGRSVLEGWGMSKNRPGLDMGDVAGFGLEMATDPLNWIGLGAIGRTAGAARGAKAANSIAAAKNPAIEASNAMSQAMRAKGALPEEMLPQAQRYIHYVPDTRVRDAEMVSVPGVLPDNFQGRYGDQVYTSQGHPYPITKASFGWERKPLYDEAVWPELRRYDPDDLEDVRDRINQLHQTLAGEPLRGPGSGARSMFYGPAPSPYTQPLAALDEMAHSLATTNVPSIGTKPQTMRMIQSRTDEAFKPVYPALMNDISLDQGSLRQIGLGPGEAGVRTGGPDVRILDGESNDIFEQILKDPADPMYKSAKAYEELSKIKSGLKAEMDRMIRPPADAHQGYFALPNPKFIDRDLDTVLKGEEFPTTLLASIERSLDGMGQKYPQEFGMLSPYFKKDMDRAREFLGDSGVNQLVEQLSAGRAIPGVDQSVFSGGQTFLPYIAPKIEELLQMQEIPRQSKALLASLLGYNTLAPMGRGGNGLSA